MVGAGAAPATGWLAESGLEIDDGVVCDETLATGAPGVYAAGDVARWTNPAFGERIRLEHWTATAEQGDAARNALRPGEAQLFETVSYFWSDWYEHRLQFIGVPTAEEVRMVTDDTDSESFLMTTGPGSGQRARPGDPAGTAPIREQAALTRDVA